MLAKLDELEDHPRYYERRPEQVTMTEDNKGSLSALFIIVLRMSIFQR